MAIRVWDQSLTSTWCWDLGYESTWIHTLCVTSHSQVLFLLVEMLVCCRSRCSRHGGTCPVFLEVSADKVTGLIDVCLQSPSPVYRFNTNLHFWGAGEQSACGDERHRRNPPQTSWSVLAVKVAVLHCSHSCATPGCDIYLCPILQENCPHNTKLCGSLLSSLFAEYQNASVYLS